MAGLHMRYLLKKKKDIVHSVYSQIVQKSINIMCVQKERSVCNRGGFVVDPDRWHGVHARRESEIFSIFATVDMIDDRSITGNSGFFVNSSVCDHVRL